DTGATWHKTAALDGRLSAIWIDPHSPKSDRTIYAAGPNAIYIRRDGKWSSGESPGTFKSVAAALPVFYAVSDGRIFVSEGGVKWQASDHADPANKATLIATSANHPDVAYASFDGRSYLAAKTT